MKEKHCRLTPIQIVVLSFFIILSIALLMGAKPYRQEVTENLNPAEFPFLQEGAYTLEITYENTPSGNKILVYSDKMVDEFNQSGVIYAEQELDEGSGVVRVPLLLEQPTYRVCVGTALDGEQTAYLSNVIIQSNQIIHKDNYFLSAVMLIAAVVLLICFYKLPAEKYVMPLLLVLMGALASVPLFSDALLTGDDLDFHLSRLEGIYQGLAAGDFPVRITPQQMSGYGGLTATMYPQLFLYPAALLRFFGVSLALCYKALVFCMNVATAFAGYYAAKNICKSTKIALWMSVFYTFSAYRLSNVYVRAALGEALAMVFLPLVLWGVYEILWGERRWIILVFGMTGVLGSHLLSTQMCALFMVLELVFWLFGRKKNQFGKRFLDGVKAVAVTLLLNASFLVPFLYYCGEDFQCFHIPFEVAESVAYFSQMFSLFPSITGTSMAPGSTVGEMPMTIGAALLVGVVLFLIAFWKDEQRKEWGKIGLHCLVYGGLAVLMASWIFPWDKIGDVEILSTLCASLQFSWRFLSPASVFLSLLAAIAVVKVAEEKSEYRWVYAVMAVLVAVTAWSMFDGLANQRQQRADIMSLEGSDLADGMYVYIDSEKFRPIQLDYDRSEGYIVAALSTPMEYSDYRKEGSHLYVEITPLEEKEDYLLFPLYWFPGYRVTVNGEETPSWSLGTLLTCKIPGKPAVIEAWYEGFWFFTVADVVTLITFLGILGGCLCRTAPAKKMLCAVKERRKK